MSWGACLAIVAAFYALLHGGARLTVWLENRAVRVTPLPPSPPPAPERPQTDFEWWVANGKLRPVDDSEY